MRWTPEMIAVMTEMTQAGASTRKVAEVMGLTRGSIIGKAHAIGLPLNNRDAMNRAARPAAPKRIPGARYKPSRVMLLAMGAVWR